MAETPRDSKLLEQLLTALSAGDPAAREALIEQANARVRALAHHMLQNFPGVGRWEQTDDVLNQALVRLHRSLGSVQPESPRHFLNLAAAQVRRVLIDLARKYAGPQGLGANHESRGGQSTSSGSARFVDTTEPGDYAEWAEFHECVESLPEAERELFGLLWYDGLSQAEAAEVLDISLRSVKRRWQSARYLLFRALHGESLAG
jgi:RNA polymerase sigma-70 factor (ECF subfamily)